MASQALAQNPVVRKIQTPPAKSGGAALPSIRTTAEAISNYIARIPLAKEGRQGIKHFERRPVTSQHVLAGNIPDIPVTKTPVKLDVHGPDVTEIDHPPALETPYIDKLPPGKQMQATLGLIELLGGKRFKNDASAARKAQKLLG